jgi:hypothetical protein
MFAYILHGGFAHESGVYIFFDAVRLICKCKKHKNRNEVYIIDH